MTWEEDVTSIQQTFGNVLLVGAAFRGIFDPLVLGCECRAPSGWDQVGGRHEGRGMQSTRVVRTCSHTLFRLHDTIGRK
jgi:hypothetical protein